MEWPSSPVARIAGQIRARFADDGSGHDRHHIEWGDAR